jgi:hypothetical protein
MEISKSMMVETTVNSSSILKETITETRTLKMKRISHMMMENFKEIFRKILMSRKV